MPKLGKELREMWLATMDWEQEIEEVIDLYNSAWNKTCLLLTHTLNNIPGDYIHGHHQKIVWTTSLEIKLTLFFYPERSKSMLNVSKPFLVQILILITAQSCVILN
uniref:Uncharacterized protein n=1 Tax=Cacopsylla melanoneura TaxID=428564 RepID=A0A8D9AY41_9HEMI